MIPASSGKHAPRYSWISLLLNSVATVQLVWFYLARVPSAMSLPAYEQGQERTPFQQRMLLMLPLRYAHHSGFFRTIAAFLNLAHGWFGIYSGHITPEGIVQAALDLFCVLLTGMLAREIYRAASPTGLLTPVVYPLVLGMITVTYCIQVNHPLRFIYDFPALAFFAIGLYLLYFRRSLWLFPGLFAGLFVVATINRETTLLLLPAYWLAQCMPRKKADVEGNCTRPTCEAGHGSSTENWAWNQLWKPQTLALTIPLLAWWMGLAYLGEPSLRCQSVRGRAAPLVKPVQPADSARVAATLQRGRIPLAACLDLS